MNRLFSKFLVLLLMLGASAASTAQSSDADLSWLAFTWSDGVASAPVDLAFDPAQTDYVAEVPAEATIGLIEWATSDGGASVVLNGAGVASADSRIDNFTSADLPLTFVFEVTAADGVTVKTYTLSIELSLSSNAALSSLTASAGTALTPFDPTGGQALRIRVPKAQASIQLTPVTEDDGAVVRVDGAVTGSGAPSAAIALPLFEPAVNSIPVAVTAEDGTTQRSYTVEVLRQPSADATLASVTNADPSYPLTQTSVATWSVELPLQVTALSLVPTASDADAVVELLAPGAPGYVVVSSGQPTAPISLPQESSSIFLRVTSQDGASTINHTVEVVRIVDPALALTSFETDGLCCSTTTELEGPFIAGALSTASAIQVKFALADPTSTMTLDGQPLANDTFRSISVATAYPAQTPLELPLVIRNAAGTAQVERTLRVIREPNVDASLASLGVTGGSLSPAFQPTTLSYEIQGAVGDVVRFVPAATDPRATVRFSTSEAPTPVLIASAQETPAITLAAAEVTATLQVTAEDGDVRTYTVRLVGDSTENSLTGLAPSAGVLSPAFLPEVLQYTLRLPPATTAIRLTPTASEAGATISVAGQAVASGQASPMIDIQANLPIEVVVAAAAGGTRTYRIDIIRNALPTISVPGQVSLAEDSYLVLPVTVADVENPAESLVITAASSNESLLNSAELTASAAAGGAERSLLVFPEYNENGGATITLTVRDGDGDTATAQVEVLVLPVNDAPLFTLGGYELQTQPRATYTEASGIIVDPVAGPSNEADQTLTAELQVRGVSGDVVVESAELTVPGGHLSVVLNGEPGSFFLDIVLRDNGGTAGGGQDRSAPQTLMINVPSSEDSVDLSLAIESVGVSGAVRTYRYVMWNMGPGDADGLRLPLEAPAGIRNVSYSCSGSLGVSCTIDPPQPGRAAHLDLPDGAFAELVVTGEVVPGATFVELRGQLVAPQGLTVDNPADDAATLIDPIGDGVFKDGFEIR